MALLVRGPSPRSLHSEQPVIEIVNQVAVMLGGTGADWISEGGGDVRQAAAEWIEMHRPAALVIDESLPAAVREAFFAAATSSGVLRVIEYARDGAGRTGMHRDALLPKSGVLASDLFADAMHYVAPSQLQCPSTKLRSLYDAAPGMRQGNSLASGISLAAGRSLEAPAKQPSRRQLQIVQARLSQSARIAKLIETSRTANQFADALGSDSRSNRRGGSVPIGMVRVEPDAGAAQAPSSATSFQAAALDQLASRFPATSAGRWAALRLEASQRSVEWRRLKSPVQESMVKTASAALAETVPVSPFQVASGGIQQASMTSPVVVPKPETYRLRKRTEEQADVDLVWEFHPLVLISREASRLRGDQGQLQPTDGTSANLQRLAEADRAGWSALLRNDGSRVVMAKRAGHPPRLDGMLDDGCWTGTAAPATDAVPVRLAYDDQYVYVAILCRSEDLRPDDLAGGSSAILRDDDLTEVDRIPLAIDIDRDLMTQMQLQVTAAPRTHDAIDGTPTWQPTWYVDTRRADGWVTFEMASCGAISSTCRSRRVRAGSFRPRPFVPARRSARAWFRRPMIGGGSCFKTDARPYRGPTRPR